MISRNVLVWFLLLGATKSYQTCYCTVTGTRDMAHIGARLPGIPNTTTDKFRLRPATDWTLEVFKTDFKLVGNKERIRRLTASDAGYHGAHHASSSLVKPLTALIPVALLAANAAAPAPVQHVSVEGGKLYYCWTHGLSQHRNHTSATCLHKAAGHIDSATAFRMQGGNNTISTDRPRYLPSARD